MHVLLQDQPAQRLMLQRPVLMDFTDNALSYNPVQPTQFPALRQLRTLFVRMAGDLFQTAARHAQSRIV